MKEGNKSGALLLTTFALTHERGDGLFTVMAGPCAFRLATGTGWLQV